MTIKTNTLLVKDGAQVNAGTRGVGKGGNLTVDAQDVQLIGTSYLAPVHLNVNSLTYVLVLSCAQYLVE
ncbi:MAG: hypothetical protein DSM106950_36460 [Stigonema ocellatum SAG 48.90 = DSM 106950]|nr:hypothetical protein [Stigonema ocellatum SAG 48.90 = DSM 106950]